MAHNIEVDIIEEEVDTLGITTLFSAMIAASAAELDTLFDADKIDSEIYAKVLASMMQQTMQLATSTVQQQPILNGQKRKTDADAAFTREQDFQLAESVTFNNKIKALDSYGDMIGTMGAGSLSISTDMWTTFFGMVGGLNSDASIPANTDVEKL